jgi:hypothetical protein
MSLIDQIKERGESERANDDATLDRRIVATEKLLASLRAKRRDRLFVAEARRLVARGEAAPYDPVALDDALTQQLLFSALAPCAAERQECPFCERSVELRGSGVVSRWLAPHRGDASRRSPFGGLQCRGSFFPTTERP